jgi:hypothetical protein
MKYVLFLLASVLLFATLTYGQSRIPEMKPDFGAKLGKCATCGMDVFERTLTRVEWKLADSTYRACGMSCAATAIDGKKVDSVRVVDFKSGKLVDAATSFYVLGSNVTPVRSMFPAIPFAEKETSQEFVKVHGGNALDYRELNKLIDRIQTRADEPKKE